jgi:hypothetical protein
MFMLTIITYRTSLFSAGEMDALHFAMAHTGNSY